MEKSDSTVLERDDMGRMIAHRDKDAGRLAQIYRVEHRKKPGFAMTLHGCTMVFFAMFGHRRRANHQERAARPGYIHIVRGKRQQHGVDFVGRQICPADRIRGFICGEHEAGRLGKCEGGGAQPDKVRSGEPEQSAGLGNLGDGSDPDGVATLSFTTVRDMSHLRRTRWVRNAL